MFILKMPVNKYMVIARKTLHAKINLQYIFILPKTVVYEYRMFRFYSTESRLSINYLYETAS